MAQNKSRRLLWAVCLAALAAFAAAMVWLHYQQLCSPAAAATPIPPTLVCTWPSRSGHDLLHRVAAHRPGVCTGRARRHCRAAGGVPSGRRRRVRLRPARCPARCPRPARLLLSLVVNLATAVWMPRGGYWYQGTVGGTIYTQHNVYYARAPLHCWRCWPFYRVWPTMRGDLDLRAYAVYTVLLTVATSFKASLIFAFAPALLVLLIADFVRTRAKKSEKMRSSWGAAFSPV